MSGISPLDSTTIPAAVAGPNLKLAIDTGLPGKVLESVNLLDGGEQAYPRMLLAIAQAQRSVHLEVYAFAPSGIGGRFIEALGEATKRGVTVQVLIDGWGSWRGGHVVANAVRDAGCKVRIYSRLLSLLIGHFGRNHRKILLVDDQVAFVGGMNIGDENLGEGMRLGWADVALEIRGLHSARLGEMIRGEPWSPVDSSLNIYLSGLGEGWRLRRRYLKAFASARERIHLAHGYFLPDPGIVRAITAASRRGVQVRLLLAGRSDVPFNHAATRGLYRRLLAAGVTIHEWNDSVLHAKVVAVDGRRLLVGSFNLDPFSLTNMEVLVEVANTHVISQGEAWIQDHFARSRSVTSVEAASVWQRWLLDPLGHILARLADKTSRMVAHRRRRKQRRTQTLAGTWPLRLARKAVVGVVGTSVLGFGVALIVLPGPAFVFIPGGLAILAAEFVLAWRILESLKGPALVPRRHPHTTRGTNPGDAHDI